MERRPLKRSSILRVASQFEACEVTETVTTMPNSQDGSSSSDGNYEATTFTTTARRSMKRVSFANRLQEVRFFEKDAHHSPADKAAPANRVMPAEGTDAHHSLLHDPVKLAVDGEPPTPSRMELTVANPSVAFDENTDPRFSLDDPTGSSENDFDKSAYMSGGDNSDDDSDEIMVDDFEKSAFMYDDGETGDDSIVGDGVDNPADDAPDGERNFKF